MLSLKHICFVSQVVGFYRRSFHKIVAMNHTSALQELAHASVQRCQTFVSRTLSEMSFAVTFSTRMHSSVRYVWPRSEMFATSVQKLKKSKHIQSAFVIWFLGYMTHTEGSTFTLPSVEGHYGLMKKEQLKVKLTIHSHVEYNR